MKFKYKYKNDEEKEKIIKENNNLFIFGYEYLLEEGNFIVFSDVKPVVEFTPIEIMENKISILNAENIESRKKLNQIKTSIASLTSLIATTLEEK